MCIWLLSCDYTCQGHSSPCASRPKAILHANYPPLYTVIAGDFEPFFFTISFLYLFFYTHTSLIFTPFNQVKPNMRSHWLQGKHRCDTHWGQGVIYLLGTCWTHCGHWWQVTPMCPVGTGWVHLKCPLPWDSNSPRVKQAEYIWNVPKMYSAWVRQSNSQCFSHVTNWLDTCWINFECSALVRCDWPVFEMCPIHETGYIEVTWLGTF